MDETIYIALLGEDVSVWRPAPAVKLGDGQYVVLRPDDDDPDDERWEFEPGSVVRCGSRILDRTEVRVAIGRARKIA